MDRPIIQKITDRTFSFSQRGSLAVAYRIDNENVVLIDSGFGENPEIVSLFKDDQLKVAAILHTHIHEDHISNDRLLIDAFNAEVFAGERDLKSMSSRELISKERGVWSEKYIDELQEQCNFPMSVIKNDADSVAIGNAEFKLIPLHGHSLGHVAIVTPDGVCALGDAVIMPDVLSRMKLPYTVNEKWAIESMKKIKKLDYPYYAVSHNSIVHGNEICSVVDSNLAYEYSLLETIEKLLDGKTADKTDTSLILSELGIADVKGMRAESIHFSLKARITYINSN